VFGDRVTFSAGAGHTQTAGVDADDEAENTSIQGRAEVRFGTSARATVRVYGSDATSAINESPAAIGPLPASGFVEAGAATFTPDANDPDNTRASDFLSTLLLFEQRTSSAFGYTLSLHRLSTNRLHRDGPLGVSAFEPATPTTSQFKGTIDTLCLRADREWTRRQTSQLSYEFERERYTSDAVPVNVALAWQAEIAQDSHAALIRHQVRLDALQVSASLRAQVFAIERTTFVPADRAPFRADAFAAPPAALTADLAAARSIARTGTKLRGHLGNAYRAPAMFERAGVSFGSRGYSVFGDPGLEPERSRSWDVGVDQAIAKGRALLSATWFHTRLTRVVIFDSLDRSTDPYGRSTGYRTADGRSARGLEVGATIRPRSTTHIGIAYTAVDAPAPAGGSDGLPRASAVPAHQFSALVSQHVGALGVSFELEAAGDHYVTLFDPVSFGSRAYRFGGGATSDLSAAYRVAIGRARLRLLATVDNLFDRRYYVQGFRAPGRQVRAGLAVTF
jgi:outer membrane receptor protein involved in Fe transport